MKVALGVTVVAALLASGCNEGDSNPCSNLVTSSPCAGKCYHPDTGTCCGEPGREVWCFLGTCNASGTCACSSGMPARMYADDDVSECYCDRACMTHDNCDVEDNIQLSNWGCYDGLCLPKRDTLTTCQALAPQMPTDAGTTNANPEYPSVAKPADMNCSATTGARGVWLILLVLLLAAIRRRR